MSQTPKSQASHCHTKITIESSTVEGGIQHSKTQFTYSSISQKDKDETSTE